MAVVERKRIAVRTGAPLIVSYWLRVTETIAGVQRPGEPVPQMISASRIRGRAGPRL